MIYYYIFFTAKDVIGAASDEMIDVDDDDDDVFSEGVTAPPEPSALMGKPRTQSLSALPKKKEEPVKNTKKV